MLVPVLQPSRLHIKSCQHLRVYLTSHLKRPLAARLSGSSWAGLLGELLSLVEVSSSCIRSYRKSTCSAHGRNDCSTLVEHIASITPM